MSRDYREHDFQLGRHNAQCYLAERLTLDPNNPLFAQWTEAQRTHFEISPGGELPVIPLVGDLHPRQRKEQLPAWPSASIQIELLKPKLQKRLDATTRGLLLSLLPKSAALRWVGWQGWRWVLRKRACTSILRWARNGLEEHGLAP